MVVVTVGKSTGNDDGGRQVAEMVGGVGQITW